MNKKYYLLLLGVLVSLAFFIIYDQNNKVPSRLHGTFISQDSHFDSLVFNEEENAYVYYKYESNNLLEYRGKFSAKNKNLYVFLDGYFERSTIVLHSDELEIITGNQRFKFKKKSSVPIYTNYKWESKLSHFILNWLVIIRFI